MLAKIKREYFIEVSEKSKLSLEQIAALYKALDIIFDYYGISRTRDSLSGLKIVINESLEDNDGNPARGKYERVNNTIFLSQNNPGALVHEFIHAVDFNFRSRRKSERESYITENEKAFVRFLKASGTSRHDIADFLKTFREMESVNDPYLSLPSEILARMGAYSFWKDNKESCEENPFLAFSPDSYKINILSEFGRSVCQFPFHQIDAVRQFVHHAAREEAGLQFAPWNPSCHENHLPEYNIKWYTESKETASEVRRRYAEATENLINAESEIEGIDYYHTPEDIDLMETNLVKAQKDHAAADAEYRQCISFLCNSIRNPEFRSRLGEMRYDCRIDLALTYLQDCENVLSLEKEKEKEKTHVRETEKQASG